MEQYYELARKIRDAIRIKAYSVKEFKESGNGCIRIMVCPCCQEADDWLSGCKLSGCGLSNFNRDGHAFDDARFQRPDIASYENTFSIAPGGSRVINGIWDGVRQDCDCAGFSALKIMHCMRAKRMGAGMLSGVDLSNPYLTPDNGYAAHYGALCVEVLKPGASATDKSKSYYEIYVCVSGAESEDDLRCAFEAVGIIKDFFTRSGEEFKINAPNFPRWLEVNV